MFEMKFLFTKHEKGYLQTQVAFLLTDSSEEWDADFLLRPLLAKALSMCVLDMKMSALVMR